MSEPPRPSVVTSRSTDTPWNPATTGHPAGGEGARAAGRRAPRGSWPGCATVSVIIPAWLPVKDTASTPRSARAMHSRDMEMRSPELSSMSISRSGCTELTSSASRTRSSVVLPMALTTTTTSLPARRVRATWSATARMRSASPTDVPAELLDHERHGRQGYNPAHGRPGGRRPARPGAAPAARSGGAGRTGYPAGPWEPRNVNVRRPAGRPAARPSRRRPSGSGRSGGSSPSSSWPWWSWSGSPADHQAVEAKLDDGHRPPRRRRRRRRRRPRPTADQASKAAGCPASPTTTLPNPQFTGAADDHRHVEDLHGDHQDRPGHHRGHARRQDRPGGRQQLRLPGRTRSTTTA